MSNPVLSVIAAPTPSLNGRDLVLTGLDDGTMLAVYVRSMSGREEIVRQILNADGFPKTAPVSIVSRDSGSIGRTIGGTVATKLSDGRVVVAWHLDETGLSEFAVQYQILNADGTAASSIFTISNSGYKAPDPVVTALANGGFAISYEQGSRLRTAFVDATGAIGQNVELNAAIMGNADSASLKNGGYVVVAAVANPTSGSDVTAYIRNPAGEVTTKIVAHTSGIDFPAVTCLANGNFLVVWSEAVADGYALKGTIFDASGATVSENLLLAKNSDYIGNPDVVTLADGGFALAFSKYDSSNFISVFLATYSSTGTIVDGPVEEAQIGRTAGVVEPSLSLLKDGRYTLSYAGAGFVYDPRPTAVTWYGTDADEQYGGTAFGDRLSAGGGNDKFYGFGGNDSLDGGAGNDILVGGFGKDTLTGGAGKDAFLFTTFDARRASSNVDKITDYKVSDDSIWLESGNFKGGSGSETAPGQIKKAYFTVGTKAKDRNDYYIYDKKTGYLWYDVDGSGINFAKVIAKLSPGLKMTYKEFFMV